MTLIDKIGNVVDDINAEYSKEVYLRYGDLLEAEELTEQLNVIGATQNKKYPFIYFNTDFDQQEIIEGKEYETDLYVYVINRATENQTSEYRHENEMPELREIIELLKSKMKLNGFGFQNQKERELFYFKEQKLFETPINAIRIYFTGLQYELYTNC
jgi:hypothetical protein